MIPTFIILAIALALVVSTIMFHYEALRLISYALSIMQRVPRRVRIMLALIMVFVPHLVSVGLYAVVYDLLDTSQVGLGALLGQFSETFDSYYYFSLVSYTSLGFGDIYPAGPMRLLVGIEALNGLLLITWTATYTYLLMQKLWGIYVPHSDHH